MLKMDNQARKRGNGVEYRVKEKIKILLCLDRAISYVSVVNGARRARWASRQHLA